MLDFLRINRFVVRGKEEVQKGDVAAALIPAVGQSIYVGGEGSTDLPLFNSHLITQTGHAVSCLITLRWS